MTSAEKREKRLAKLLLYMLEEDCSRRDALLDNLFVFYESVFDVEQLSLELNSKSDDELMKLYLNY